MELVIKLCIKCGQHKPTEIRRRYCKDCRDTQRRLRESTPEGKANKAKWNKNFRDSNPSRVKSYKLKDAFGIGLEEYDTMLAAQGGVCAVCKQTEQAKKYLYVDHDHTTNEIRGLLCGMCNFAIGFFDDDDAKLASAITYLERQNGI